MAAVKIYTDENVNPAIVEGLRRRGVSAWSSADVGNLGISDKEQLEYATTERAILFTHDVDLIPIAKNWMQEGIVFF